MPNPQSVQATASANTTSGSKMFDWSSQERVDAVPHDIWPGLSSGKGLDRIFVGRKAELANLKQRHGRAPETIDSNMPADEQSFITVVTNSPGVGKSALLERMEQDHVTSGGHSLRLVAQNLRNANALHEALQASEPMQQAAMLRDAKVLSLLTQALLSTGDAQTGFAVTVFEYVVKAGMRLGRAVPKKPGTEAHARMVHTLANHGSSLSAMDILRIMAEGTQGRLLLVVDEAQELGEMTGHETATLLQELGDPSHRARLGLQSGGVLLAGLPDALQRLRELHKSRAYNLHLDPLPEADVQKLLERAFRQGDPNGVLTGKPVRQLTGTLTTDFGQWTHHAHAAAFAVAYTVRNAIRRRPRIGTIDTDQLLDWTRTNAALGTCQLYDQTAELGRGIVGTDGVYEAAQAMHQTGMVPGGLLRQAMARQRAREEGNPIDKMDNHEGLQALLHCGLVARKRSAGGGTEEVVIPIPSLTDYLMVTKGKAERRTVEHPGNPAPDVEAEQAGEPEESWFEDDDQ